MIPSRNGAQDNPPDAPPVNGIEFLSTALRKRVKAVLREIPGVREGQDMECLHDIRVAARRLRSALSLLTDFFPERTTRRWRKCVQLTMVASHDCRFEQWALENYRPAFEDTFGCRLMLRSIVRQNT